MEKGTIFECQIDILKRFCKIDPDLLVISDRWLLGFDAERDKLS